MFIIDFQSDYMLLYILLALFAIAISWWSYRNIGSEISKFKKYLLMSLRTIGIVAIGLLLVEPLLTVFSEKTVGDRLGVVIDLSSSMNVEEAQGRRHEIAISAFSENMPDKVPLEFFGFTDSLILLDGFPDSAKFSGQATDISLAITRPQVEKDEQLGALLVITDGSGNIGVDPLKSASAVNVPVYSLVVGSGVNRQDIFITRVDYPPVAYTNTELPLEVEFGAEGFAGRSVILEIREDNKVLASKRVTLPPDGAFSLAEFNISVAEEGAKNLKATISILENESYRDNNSRNFTIKFLKDKIDVLILSRSLNWELKFLKKALESDPHLQVKSALAEDRGRFKPIPWGQQELVIAMDMSSNVLGSQINNLAAAVEAGAGFLYLSGYRTRAHQLDSWDILAPVEPGPKMEAVSGEFFPIPSKEARVSAILNIEGLLWHELPPLKSVIVPVKMKEDALLMMDVITDTGEHWPVLVGGKYKRGKTAVITGFPWWPRYFRPGSEGAEVKRIERFWSNLARWLVTREDLEKFNVVTDKPVYKLGEPIGFTATVFDDNYDLVNGARVRVIVLDSSKTERELLLSGQRTGRYEGDFGSPAPGEYRFEAVAIVGGDTLGRAEGGFIVESASLEMENPSANYPLMAKIAEITGGKSFTVDDFSEFARSLKLKTKKSEVFSEYRLTGHLYVLLFIILIFTAEWGIRKFSQLA